MRYAAATMKTLLAAVTLSLTSFSLAAPMLGQRGDDKQAVVLHAARLHNVPSGNIISPGDALVRDERIAGVDTKVTYPARVEVSTSSLLTGRAIKEESTKRTQKDPPRLIDPCPESAHVWWHVHPPVGTWIAVLALLGVIVPLIRSPDAMGKYEKAIWTFVMFCLVALEMRTLYLDRAEHDADQNVARCREIESFKAIADGIKSSVSTSQAGFSATIGHVDGVLRTTQDVGKLARENLLAVTGGDSFAYVYPGMAPGRTSPS